LLKIIIQYWGRRGAGPVLYSKIYQAFLSRKVGAVGYSGLWSLPEEGGGASQFLVAKPNLADKKNYWSFRFVLRVFYALFNYCKQLFFGEINYVFCVMISPFTPILCVLARLRGVPYFILGHDFRPHPGEDTFFSRALLFFSYYLSSGVVVLSQSVRQQFLESSWFRSKPIALASHGSLICQRRVQGGGRILQGIPRILFVGRLKEYKGLDIFVDSVIELERGGKSFDARIVGSGKVSDINLRKIESCENLSLIQGWLEEAEFVDHVDQADIVVLPYREASQSGVVGVAFPLGVPVVATPVGGLVEQIEHGVTGLISTDVSPHAIAIAIERLLGDSRLYSHISAKQVEASDNRGDWLDLVDQVESLRRKCRS
jgi:glycosyltransferase involved in cell wall biosynthesis